MQGSLEAIKASLEKLRNDEIKVDIIHQGVGGFVAWHLHFDGISDRHVGRKLRRQHKGSIARRRRSLGVAVFRRNYGRKGNQRVYLL